MNISAEANYKIDAKETFQVSMSLYQPWSIPIMRVTLPAKILNMMTGLSDAILEKEGSQAWGDQLAGQIARETLIPIEILKRAGLAGFFESAVKRYIIQCLCQRDVIDLETATIEDFKTHIAQMWVVSQFENEYNPTHHHGEYDVAGVLYLKIPKMLPSRKPHRVEDDGSITFYGGYSGDQKLSSPTLQIKPMVGELYLFSAHQLHSVYPFRCPKGEIEMERRSIAFNALFERAPQGV